MRPKKKLPFTFALRQTQFSSPTHEFSTHLNRLELASLPKWPPREYHVGWVRIDEASGKSERRCNKGCFAMFVDLVSLVVLAGLGICAFRWGASYLERKTNARLRIIKTLTLGGIVSFCLVGGVSLALCFLSKDYVETLPSPWLYVMSVWVLVAPSLSWFLALSVTLRSFLWSNTCSEVPNRLKKQSDT